MQQTYSIMAAVAGIKYTKSTNGGRGSVLIDLDVHGDNELLEDFLDLMEIESSKKETGEYIPLEDFMREEYKRRGMKYEAV